MRRDQSANFATRIEFSKSDTIVLLDSPGAGNTQLELSQRVERYCHPLEAAVRVLAHRSRMVIDEAGYVRFDSDLSWTSLVPR
ncbi:hypothetical protein [Dietzia sp. B32]|uniref:hypothetical protein n=1 Tax=Dietzia sp. B32 TaxID=2915130 RepID=UPI0021AD89C5|nr:hypothetical protein [Dietzia sp. B32]UVE95242.1 hypothetical protein L8M95_17430 [Dietzia sp. B32]